MTSHGSIDLSFFTNARQLIEFHHANRCPSTLPVRYHRAYSVLKMGTHGKTWLAPMKGFMHVKSGSPAEAEKMEGITKVLTSLFHPLELGVSTGGAKTGGSGRGMRVDRQLSDLINLAKRPENGFEHYTLLTMAELKRLGLQPFCAQYAAAAPALGIATSLDLLCINTEGKVVNVQLKTGFDENYDKPARSGMKMMSPYADCQALKSMPDTHHNRHRLQLISEHMIAGTFVDDSVLLVISERQSRVFHVDRDQELVSGVLANLRQRNEADKNNKDVDELDMKISALKRSAAIRKVIQQKRKK